MSGALGVRTEMDVILRIAEVEKEDFFGAIRSDLMRALPFATARHNGFVAEHVTEEEWEKGRLEPAEAARDYLTFAIGKALDHRGLSANRSVDHLRAWTWLAGDHVYRLVIEEPSYEQYGVPHLKAAAEWCGYQWDSEDPHLNRMAEGLECSPGCDEGCGL